MQDLNDLYYYAQVVAFGGFAPASRGLGVPKSKLSRRVAQLEARLGVRLLQRSTRRFAVTEIGQTYYAHCKAMLVEADAAQRAIALTQVEPRGVVRITCPVALLDARVAPMLADFMQQQPGIEVHLEATDRRVDVIGEAIDIALRVRPAPLEDSELVLRRLRDTGQCLVASPALLQRWGVPQSPEELPVLPSLAMGTPQGEHTWTLLGPGGAEVTIAHHPRFITRGMIALRLAAIAGVGVVQLFEDWLRPHLARGALEPLLEPWWPSFSGPFLYYPGRRLVPPPLRAFIDFVKASD